MALESFRVILSVLSGHNIFDIALIDIYGSVRELSHPGNSQTARVICMDVGQQNGVDLAGSYPAALRLERNYLG